MTLAINKDSFSGNQGVTCYSCHRGQTHVVGLPPFPLPPRESFLEDAPKPDAGLPTAEQVFDKYIQAIGGKSAFDKLKTRVWKGTYITSNGASLPYEVQQAAPNKFLTILTTPRQGVFLTGLNGASGWQQNPRGVHELGGPDLAQLKSFAGFFGGVNLKEQYSKMRVIRKEKVGEREAYFVRAESVGGNNERLYFDTQTGLLLRRIVIEKTVLLPLPEQTDFEDYREVDGVKLPFTIQVYDIDPAHNATRKFTEIKHNVSVDDAKFNMPVQKQ
jgi:outer membrane lipoprotein-sorting protein